MQRSLVAILMVGIVSLFMVSSVYAQTVDCTPLAEDAPEFTLGLVFPSDALLTPGRIAFFEGAMAMIDAMNQCGGYEGVRVFPVHAFAEDYDSAITAARRLVDQYDIRLIIGGGSGPISLGLSNAAQELDIVFWDTTEGVDTGDGFAFSATSNGFQRGAAVGAFVQEAYGSAASVALIFNDRAFTEAIADGVRHHLGGSVRIVERHHHEIDAARLATAIRREGIDVVVIATFQDAADELWRAMQDADANVVGWLNVGDPGYRLSLCERIGDTSGLIIIDRFAMGTLDSEMYLAFADHYRMAYGLTPGERARLSASGTFMLIRYVLPNLGGRQSVEAIREAIASSSVEMGAGLMGEGLLISPTSGANERAPMIVQQNQAGAFCTASPEALATCERVDMFSSWRERAIFQNEYGCIEPWASPDLDL